jgi:transcriptional regulator with XRE-family HTH domain
MSVDELAGLQIGTRLQTIRLRKGKTRAVVAGLVGQSEEWLKAVERGRLKSPRLPMLVRLAEALGVHIAEITGDLGGVEMNLTGRSGHEAVPAMREAIESQMLVVTGEAVDVDQLIRRTGDAWALWHSSPSPRSAVGAVLPRIIADGRRATRLLDGDQRRRAHAALSSAYALSEQLLAWVADGQLLWLTADRCMASAEQADDPLALALAAWVVGNVWRVTAREDDALRLATDAADLLTPRLDSDQEARALWGAVRLHAAITSAKMGREGDAMRYLDDAAEMAAAMPGYAHAATLFGIPNATLTGVSVHVELQKGSRAVDVADAVDPDSIPSQDRRARVWLEVARAYRQRKDNTAAVHVLQRAVNTSREAMTCHPLARTLAGELVTSGGRIVEREARALASSIGVAV